MRSILGLVSLGCLLSVIASQAIKPNSLLCSNMQISQKSTLAVKNKYKTFLLNLAKDTTLADQKNRAKTWLNNNFKEVGLLKDDLSWVIPNVHSLLEARWRIVTYYKGLLAKIKPKVAAAKFTEIKNLMWKTDADATNNAMSGYETWKQKALALLTGAKQTEIKTLITNWETADGAKSPKNFNTDSMMWMSPPGFSGCAIS